MHVAIVEDDQENREQQEEFIRRYGYEHGLPFEIESFADGIQIVERDASRFDIILFGHRDALHERHGGRPEAARRRRRRGAGVCDQHGPVRHPRV